MSINGSAGAFRQGHEGAAAMVSGIGPGGSWSASAVSAGRSVQAGQRLAQAAHTLSDALLVLDEGESHMGVTARPEAHPR